VSVTGGEPLLQARRLGALLQLLVERGHSVYLETNGTLPGGLASVLDWIDHIGMDIKLDSVDHEGVDLEVHRRFLETGAARHLFVKIVIGPATAPGELDRAVAMVHEVAPATEIFLQPVTPFADVATAPSPGQVLDLQERALRVHPRVRVVPQTHKLIDQL
jgi:organic radical activating enzyme